MKWVRHAHVVCAILALVLHLYWGSTAAAAPAPSQAITNPSTSKAIQAAGDLFRANGWWWGGPSLSGTGFFFEAQGSLGFVAFFLYDDQGNAVWYSASGSFSALNASTQQYQFTGTLKSYRDGQPASSNTPRTPTETPVGPVTITFTGNNATVLLPNRGFSAQRFAFSDLSKPALVTQPEVGWYWNAQQNGRGYAIEVQNNQVFMTMFHYNADGSPTWNVVSTSMTTAGGATGSFQSFTGGQTLDGPYKPPVTQTFTPGFEAVFNGACNGVLRFPGNATPTTVSRFAFGVDSALACRVPSTTPPVGGYLQPSLINARCANTVGNVLNSASWLNCLQGSLLMSTTIAGALCTFTIDANGTAVLSSPQRRIAMTAAEASPPIGFNSYSKSTSLAFPNRYVLRASATTSNPSYSMELEIDYLINFNPPRLYARMYDLECSGTF